jgi:cytosine/adenosine deaminase-related metal-dependent hydrolase
MFETMKFAALLHKVADFDYDRWVGAKEVIKMATRGGARCGCLNGEIGILSVGMRADMVLLDLKKLPFFPRNNLLHQLVFCENGQSVDTVFVDGTPVVEAGKMTTINEDKLIEEAMERGEEVQNKIRWAVKRGVELAPYVREAYYKCVKQGIGFRADSKN